MSGASRRYECSLTSKELKEAEAYILKGCLNGTSTEFDPRYSGIIEDLKVRGYLRCGVTSDYLKAGKGETLRTTVEGERLLRSM